MVASSSAPSLAAVELELDRALRFVDAYAPDVLLILDPGADLVYVSESVERLSGWDRSDLLGRSALQLIHPDDLDYTIGSIFEATGNPGSHGLVELRLLCRDGSWLPCEVQTFNPPEDPSGWMLVSLRDISDRSALPERRRALEQLTLWMAAECAGVSVGGLDATMDLVTSRLGELIDADEVIIATVPEDRSMVQAWSWVRPDCDPLLRPSTQVIELEHAASSVEYPSRLQVQFGEPLSALVEQPATDGDRPVGLLTVSWHVPDARRYWDEGNGQLLEAATRILTMTARRVHREQALAHRALHDHLTGIGNRARLVAALDHELNRESGRGETGLVIAFCDLDHFKRINDSFGHDVGDEVLVGVADHLRTSVRHGDLVCRVGGDEFVVMCPNVASEELARELGDRIASQVRTPIAMKGGSVSTIEASIGLVLLRGRSAAPIEPSDVLRAADAAMYAAKAQPGRGTVFTTLDLADLG